MSMRALLVVAAGAISIGCSLDRAGTAELTNDSAIAVDSERLDSIFELDDTAASDDTIAPDTAPVDTTPPCDESACGPLPAGGKRVALVDRGVGCPAGFDSSDIVEETAGNACGCSCAVSAAPTCPAAGILASAYGDSTACATPGSPLTVVDSSTCSSLPGAYAVPAYYRLTPPGPAGGACTPTPTTSAVSRPRRICEPRVGTCAASMCGSPFTQCVEVTGACPSAFPNAHRIGLNASVACPACTCTLSASCSGLLTLYDPMCAGATTAGLRADGVCNSATPSSTTFSAYKYTPNAPSGVACGASFTTAPGTRTFVGQRTLCCK